MQPTDQLPVWQELLSHSRDLEALDMRNLFSKDPARFEKFSIEAPGIFLDFSKNRISEKTVDLLCQLASDRGLANKIEALFKGEILNISENRPASHTTLRDFENAPLDVKQQLEKMRLFCEKNRHIRDIVNIGIGGSELGPAMVYQALKTHEQHPRCHFIASYDLPYLEELLKTLNPKTTLFLVVSKTFSTAETLANADVVKAYLKGQHEHLIAITAKPEVARQYGVPEENIFVFWDWVGGRYSLWSSVGLSIALSFGFSAFEELLQGAHAMDEHFRRSPFKNNMPVVLGLLGIWYQNFFGAQTQAVIPYSRALKLLSDYLQQLQMESLGKRVTAEGRDLNYETGAILWGGVGTNSQHSFHQLLMQGTHLIPVDFILPLQKHPDPHFQQLAAHCIAQSKALLEGYSADEIRADLEKKNGNSKALESLVQQKLILGNHPSNTIFLDALSPFSLGALLALYEHKIFVQSVIWQINAFDQWGVERGKVLAEQIITQIQSAKSSASSDSSTAGLIRRVLRDNNSR